MTLKHDVSPLNLLYRSTMTDVSLRRSVRAVRMRYPVNFDQEPKNGDKLWVRETSGLKSTPTI